MAEWRWMEGWSEAELAERLERARTLPRNFAPDEEMSPRTGWNLSHSHAIIAREPPGPPLPGGAFERVWRAIQRFHHSDPRIVVAHFHASDPLDGRAMLLELQAMGLHYLCPVRVAATRAESAGSQTLRGLAIDTLEGHIERGREWFLLDKDHVTGEVRFRIEAVWREGDFPNEWSHLGFEVVGRRYQRAWHRLVHLRLRRIAAGLEPAQRRGPGDVVHAGTFISTEPVQFMAWRGRGRREADVEQEAEDMRRDRLWRALGLGALAGVRSAGAPAVLTWNLRRRGKPLVSGWRVPQAVGAALPLLALGEVIADKLPFTPARTKAASLVARAFSGAFAGAATARKGESKVAPALLGSAAAAAATFGSYRLRKLGIDRSRRLGYAVAAAEDLLVLWAGNRLGRATARAAR